MTSQEFVQITERFTPNNADSQYLRDFLAELNDRYINLQTKIIRLASSQPRTSNAGDAQSDFYTDLTSAANEMRDKYRTQTVWAGVADLRRTIESFTAAAIEPDLAVRLFGYLRSFSETYEDFVKRYSEHTTWMVVQAGNDLFYALQMLQHTAVMARNALIPSPDLQASEGELQLAFISTPTVAEFADKLSALLAFYEEICALLSVSTASTPLKIVKIESGSWFSRLIGSAPALGVMSRLIERAAQYFYETFTTQGQISVLPRNADAIERILELKTNLEAHGVNTAGMEENIAKSAVLLSQRLNSLLGGEPKVVINAVEISIGGEMLNTQLEGNRTLQLETPTSETAVRKKKKRRRRKIDRDDK